MANPGGARQGGVGTQAFEIRAARRADLPVLARFGAALARAHHRWDPDRFMRLDGAEEGYAWWLGKELRNPEAVVLAAVRRGRGAERVVGYGYGRIEPRDWNTLRERCGVGVDLMVEPRARGCGIGRALVEELARRLGEKGAPRVVIGVATANAAAQKAFAKLGFRATMVEMTRELPRAPRSQRTGALSSGSAGPRR
jgi:ribosomal protein S18 acetylase RimI-like enzyme